MLRSVTECCSDVSNDRYVFIFRVKQAKNYIPVTQHDHKNEVATETSVGFTQRQCHIPDNKVRLKRRYLSVAVSSSPSLLS
jgi:hypothetical protein